MNKDYSNYGSNSEAMKELLKTIKNKKFLNHVNGLHYTIFEYKSGVVHIMINMN